MKEWSVMVKQGYLVLENGMVFEGWTYGTAGQVSGEVVFNTSMTGYQEVLTDPSYAGQIVVMTFPLIGNYGLSQDRFESRKIWARGFVVREACPAPSHYQQKWDLDGFLQEYSVMGLYGLDTRALTRILRSHGTMGGVLTTDGAHKDELVAQAKEAAGVLESGLVLEVTREKPEVFNAGGPKRVVLYDFGAKQNIINSLAARGCEVIAVPAKTSAGEVMDYRPDGIVLSNGPGDPKACGFAIQSVQSLLGKVPIMGICLGHQILGLALGGDTYKLTFGHRGANHPVKDLRSGKVYITSQNHGYALRADSLAGTGAETALINLNDQTVEGIVHPDYKAFSVQYHPEGAPGPEDSAYLFDDFVKAL
ncbi:MAG: glutamine-hydrolyzing carbamoyl-phosphate synthase small subunit [Solirubrobacterales bacterium]